MPRKPRGRGFSGSDLPGEDDLEGPLAEVDPGDLLQWIRQFVGGEAVELVALPVEFLLQGNHHAAVGVPGRTPGFERTLECWPDRGRRVGQCADRPVADDGGRRERGLDVGEGLKAAGDVERARGGEREGFESGAGELVPQFPLLVTYAPPDSAVSFIDEDLLHPKAGSRTIEHAEECEVVCLCRLCRQFDDGSRPVEHLAAAVEDEVVVRGDEGEGNGERDSQLVRCEPAILKPPQSGFDLGLSPKHFIVGEVRPSEPEVRKRRAGT